MASFSYSSIAWQVALPAAVAAIGVFTFKMIKNRMIFYRLKKQGLVRSCDSLSVRFLADALIF